MDDDGGNEQNLLKIPILTDSRPGPPMVNGLPSRLLGRMEHFSHEIYVMDADGGNQQRLTENRKNDWSPSWSPDGTRIVFSADRKGDWVNFEIYVMDADGGNQQRLTENRSDDWSPSWSPDGKRIAFSSYGDNNPGDIYVMDTDGGNQQQLTNHPRSDGNPAWFVPAFAVAPRAKSLQYGDGSNRATDNINYQMVFACIGAAFENKRRVGVGVSILCSH